MGQTFSSNLNNADVINNSLSSDQPSFLADRLPDNNDKSDIQIVNKTNEEKSVRLEDLARRSSGSCMKDRIDCLIEGYLLSNKSIDTLPTSSQIGNCKRMADSIDRNTCPSLQNTPNGKITSEEKQISKSDETKLVTEKEIKIEKLGESISDLNNVSSEIVNAGVRTDNNRHNFTLQTFIEKVLDTSLSSVEKSENELKKSADQRFRGSVGAQSKCLSNPLKIHKPPENHGRMSLQDRIEQVLEQTFNAHIEEKEIKKDSFVKSNNLHISSEVAKNPTDSAFNPQDLVDKMINQTEEINKLLSPSKDHFVSVSRNPASNRSSPDMNQATLKKSYVESHLENKDESHLHDPGKMEMSVKHSLSYGHKSEHFTNTYSSSSPVETKYGPIPVNHSTYQNMVPVSTRYAATISSPVIDARQFYSQNNFPKPDPDSASHLLHINKTSYLSSLSPGCHSVAAARKSEDANVSVGFRECRCVGCISKTGHISLENSPGRSPVAAHKSNVMERHLTPHKPYIYPTVPVSSSFHKSPDVLKPADVHRMSAPTYFPPAVMPLTVTTSAQGHIPQYSYIPQLIPSNPPIPSPKEYQNQQMSLSALHKDDDQHFVSVSSHSSHDTMKRHYEKAIYGTEVVALRPSSVPSEHVHSTYPVPSVGMPWRQINNGTPGLDLTKQKHTLSEKWATADEPLDLSCKKTSHREHKINLKTSDSLYFYNSQTLVNTHIRHLEKSVDKYCQKPHQLPCSAGLAGGGISSQFTDRLGPMNESVQPQMAPSQGHEQSQPSSQHGLQNLHSTYNDLFQNNVSLRYPSHIPNVSSKNIPMNRNKTATLLTNVPKPANSINTEGRSDNLSRQSRRGGVSKHEPIQNIIGNHNPSDILYLICQLCDQTYGSPYGFRKHFRNQHGFEPRAEHTIVQTISATKTALKNTLETVCSQSLQPATSTSLSNPMRFPSPHNDNKNIQRFKNVLNEKLGSVHKQTDNNYITSDKILVTQSNLNLNQHVQVSVRNLRPEEGSNYNNARPSDYCDIGEERKCLTCPECQQTFQLNDFGSYKRHCRQHSHSRSTGPFMCTECGLSFSEHDLYKEHVAGHYTSGIVSSCNLCNVTFASSAHLNDHLQIAHPESVSLSSSHKALNSLYREDVSTSHDKDIPELNSIPILSGSHEVLADRQKPNIDKIDTCTVEKKANQIIACRYVRKCAAESATISASPDSSSEIVSTVSHNDVTATVDSQLSEWNSCNDSSSAAKSVGDCGMDSVSCSTVNNNSPVESCFNQSHSHIQSALNVEHKKNSKSDSLDTCSQNSSDSFSQVDTDNVKVVQMNYQHKKFGSNRKRKDSFPALSTMSDAKSPKMSSSGNESENSVSMESIKSTIDYSPNGGPYDSVDPDRKFLLHSKESDTDSLSEFGYEGDKLEDDSKLILKNKCDSGNNNNIKHEARHQLPFVWDRVTRQQAGKNIRPPKYH